MYNYRSFPLDMEGDVFDRFRTEAPQAGSRAPDGELTDLESGGAVQLSTLWKRTALVIEFGSFT